jgi:deoxyribodipyrimidine photo-lyase
METAIWWIRRDLRLTDNPALQQALESSAQVIPLFILDDSLLQAKATGEHRHSFLIHSLEALDKDLRELGSRLILRRGEPFEVLSSLIDDQPIQAIFAQADISPYARQRDRRITINLPLSLVGSSAIHPPDRVLKGDGNPYTVFTPYSRVWRKEPLVSQSSEKPRRISTPETLESVPAPTPTHRPGDLFPAGEAQARKRLERFTTGPQAPIYQYEAYRNRLDMDGTSILSAYLRFGIISPQKCFETALEARDKAPSDEARGSVDTWLNELAWRDFFMSILYHFPTALNGNLRPRWDSFPWKNDAETFNHWIAGQTGYPLIDAAMRQLTQTGWMHNRARMITASFLTKDLLIDWRWGEGWFRQQLIDGDPAANNGGWQWVAGTGLDAAPYFRIFNPITQSKKFDPVGIMIRRWVPELEKVPDSYIHEPWRMPQDVQRRAHCRIGVDYPHPIVDHAWARKRALALYKRVRLDG